MFGKPDTAEEWITIPKKKLTHSRPMQFLVGNYCLFDENSYYVPAVGFKKMDVSLF